MMDLTLEKRADKSEELLRDLSVSEMLAIGNLSYYKTPAFEQPSSVREQDFSPCEVGFSWTRDRVPEPSDRFDADIDLGDVTDLPDDLSVGTNVWFNLRFTIPTRMAGHPVYLRFAAKPLETVEWGPDWERQRVEALCYRDGDPWQAFDGGRDELLLTEHAKGGEEFDLLVEVGTTVLWGGLDVEEFRLEAAELYSTRLTVEDLARNVSILNDLRKTIPDESPNRARILRAIADASETFAFQADTEDEFERSAERALADLLDLKDSLSSDLTGYRLCTIGHAHIDLAWLWPWSETVRKSARSFANVLTLMEEYPEFRFIQSQPHLYKFLRDRYPDLFERVTERIDEGRWEPVGALWVESDINVSGGEALARQFLYGKRYFREEFDVDPRTVFLPDVFGYSAALPGIARAADCPYFLTQKMSWNESNEFPHHTFTWEGIDGSAVLAHFPPADTYNGRVTVDQVRSSVAEYEQNDVLDEALYLVGWGDGGGGTTREMLERSRVVNEIGSLPDIEFDGLEGFFERIEAVADNLPRWVGELYLEKHRGTLTSQASTKRNNRKGEFALREAEIWATLAAADGTTEFEYPKERLGDAWQTLLFNQFHDILPGSSVRDVYVDAERDYSRMFDLVASIVDEALLALFGPDPGTTSGAANDAQTNEGASGDPDTDHGSADANETDTERNDGDRSERICVLNSLSWTRSPMVETPVPDGISVANGEGTQSLQVTTDDGDRLPVQVTDDDPAHCVFEAVDVPPIGARTFEMTVRNSESEHDSTSDAEPMSRVENLFAVSERAIENKYLRVAFDEEGYLASVYDKEAEREILKETGNHLLRYRDLPLQYEAWDIEEDVYDIGEPLPAPTAVEVVETGPVRAVVRQHRSFGDSTLRQDLVLYRNSKRIDFVTEVDWHESQQLLKAHFPLAIHANEAIYEVQFGHHTQPTHANTSWDAARFEEPHQKWVDVAEHGYGVALLNDCKYGVHVDGTDVSLSLLRAPESPDPRADQGRHRFTYALYPHTGTHQEASVVETAYDLNTPSPVRSVEQTAETSAFEIDTPGVVLEALKRAEDDPSEVVCRLYESWGRRTTAILTPHLSVEAAREVTLVEDNVEPLEVEEGRISLEFDPFEIKSVALRLTE